MKVVREAITHLLPILLQRCLSVLMFRVANLEVALEHRIYLFPV